LIISSEGHGSFRPGRTNSSLEGDVTGDHKSMASIRFSKSALHYPQKSHASPIKVPSHTFQRDLLTLLQRSGTRKEPHVTHKIALNYPQKRPTHSRAALRFAK